MSKMSPSKRKKRVESDYGTLIITTKRRRLRITVSMPSDLVVMDHPEIGACYVDLDSEQLERAIRRLQAVARNIRPSGKQLEPGEEPAGATKRRAISR